MHLNQIVVLGLLLALVGPCTGHKCYNESEAAAVADRKLRHHYWQPLEPPASDGHAPCPVSTFSQDPRARQVHERSLAPWVYESITLPDHFPSTYVQARCLCTGCIQFRRDGVAFQSLDFYSVGVNQSRIFLKRELCKDQTTYQLTPVWRDVTVACACVRAMSSP